MRVLRRLAAYGVLVLLGAPLLLAPVRAQAQTTPVPLRSLSAPVPDPLRSGTHRDTADDAVRMRVRITPGTVHVGSQLLYHADVLVPRGTDVRFGAPDVGGDFTWGARRAGRGRAADNGANGRTPRDSVWVEMPLQVFRSGRVDVAGLTLQIDPMPGTMRAGATRFPITHLLVLPTVSGADSAADLRPVRTLGAPWWERVPWPLVAAVMLAVALLFALIAWIRRRLRRKPVLTAPAMPVAPRVDPGLEALNALAQLRAETLPELGRFDEHALRLTRILRRFLERAEGSTLPGDTSAELVARLRASRLEAGEVERLEGLLGFWDRVKFARAPMGVDEARRCEDAVEALVRRRSEKRSVA